ncbi:glycosyltransferase EpsD [Evansella vedderi]|uniref:Glycosyltransferase EpsD n=1 Tax=Evansella vedderi TaxID=38282 RepID=A0ABT9ZPI3_9BACI|nr:glycosyltransferase family 4 protein [Evansella vedderi]MDQ0253156.1 glycosyltransferase EpsD [Evansella vedderi]
MEKKILFCATVDYHFSAFHLPIMKWFKEQGWEVHVAASGQMTLPYTDKKFDIPIKRTPFHIANFKAYKELKEIINENNYTIIHCHTPLGGVLSRLAGRKARKSGTKVIYTAHGFHFCKGAPLLNWLIYYPIERFLSRYTDCLITINSQDYQLAKKHRFPAGNIEYVNGVGVDTDHFKPLDSQTKLQQRKKYGYDKDDFLLFYAAEFNKNKNQQLLIRALAKVKEEAPKARLLLAGEGALFKECKDLAQSLGVAEQVDFLGFRKDIVQLLPICDLAVGSSYREGLPVNIMEAMACGLPVLASENRGHSELVKNKLNGFVQDPDDVEQFAATLKELYESKKLRETLGTNSISLVKKFSLPRVKEQLVSIYTRYMVEDNYETENKHRRSYL